MTDITSFQSPPSLFKSSYSLAIRIWHWLTFIAITASIVMVVLASTIFTMKGNTPMVQEQIQHKGGVATPEQARAVAHEYSDKLWMLHKYIGLSICALLLMRIIIEISSSKEKKLLGKIRNAIAIRPKNRQQQQDRQHYLLVKWGYVVFYCLIIIMALTGLGLAFEDVPLFRSNHSLITNIHSFVQYIIYFYILSHLVGVIRADNLDNRGIVSAMINGGERSAAAEAVE